MQEINLPPQSLLACLQSSAYCSGAQPSFNGLLPYLGYSSLKMAFTGSNSNYNSLQAELHGQITKDLYLQTAYTWSRALDPSTGNGNGWDLDPVSNPYVGWQYDYGPSSFDRTQIFFVNWVYNMPFLKNSSSRFLRTAVAGWTLSGIVTAETGTPVFIGYNGQNVASIFSGDVLNRPDVIAPITYSKTANEWFNPASFAAPAAGTWGNLGYNSLRGPGRNNWDLSLFKTFVLNERGSAIQFRAECFNAWNHTQFGGPGQTDGISNNFEASNFGAVTSAWDPRVFQLGLKVMF